MGVQTLERHAMAAVFFVTVAHDCDRYARQAVAAAFDELERLESLLSRFVENSDVSRLNRLAPGAAEIVDADTFACLQLALGMERRTGGAFNIAYGSRQPTAGRKAIRLLSQPPRVLLASSDVRLDLGGIGKGFGLDRVAAVLRQWEIASALCWCQQSTYLAHGASPEGQGWTVRFGPGEELVELQLFGRSISGSGSRVKGPHIVDPADGRRVVSERAAWATARTAAEADAFSTALMVMSHAQVHAMLSREPAVGVYVTTDDGHRWAVQCEPANESREDDESPSQ
jgi:thiamine biosynthesis lipoprotein